MRKRKMMTVLFLSIFAGICPAAVTAAPYAKPFKIVASFYPVYIMTLNVIRGVPGASVTCLATPMTGCLHDYSLTTGDMRALEDAQLVAVNGAGMEPFLEKIAQQFPHLTVTELASGIPLIEDPDGGGPNPHVWVNPRDAAVAVRNLAGALAKADPAHADLYRQNAADYISKLEKLAQEMHAALDRYRGTPVVMLHESFAYLARELGLRVVAVIQHDPGSEPGAGDLIEAISQIKLTGARIIFSEPQYSDRAAQTIAREAGVSLYELDSAVTGPEEAGAYLDAMKKNVEVLKTALVPSDI